MPNEKKGLSGTTITLMVSTALLFDVLQILLAFILLGWLIIPVAYLTFWLWFKMQGINFFSFRRAPTLGIGFFLEFISVGIIPSITYTVLRISLDSKLKKFIPALDIINK